MFSPYRNKEGLDKHQAANSGLNVSFWGIKDCKCAAAVRHTFNFISKAKLNLKQNLHSLCFVSHLKEGFLSDDCFEVLVVFQENTTPLRALVKNT